MMHLPTSATAKLAGILSLTVLAGCSGGSQFAPPASGANPYLATQKQSAAVSTAPLNLSSNLLHNGSFETGTFAHWDIHNAPIPSRYPCGIINNPGLASGEPTGGLSPDPIGTDFMECIADPSHELAAICGET